MKISGISSYNRGNSTPQNQNKLSFGAVKISDLANFPFIKEGDENFNFFEKLGKSAILTDEGTNRFDGLNIIVKDEIIGNMGLLSKGIKNQDKLGSARMFIQKRFDRQEHPEWFVDEYTPQLVEREDKNIVDKIIDALNRGIHLG